MIFGVSRQPEPIIRIPTRQRNLKRVLLFIFNFGAFPDEIDIVLIVML